jgi:hypothetical protein
MTSCNCPICDAVRCLVIQDEVDIGVGVQTHVLGWECEQCGEIAACNLCGGPVGPDHDKECSFPVR